MKKMLFLTLVCFFSLGIAICQKLNDNYKRIVIKDSIKQIQIYSPDSLLVEASVFRYNPESGAYELKQNIEYDNLGQIVSFYSYYGKDWDTENQLKLDQIVIDLNEMGKPKRVFFTNDFKLFRNYIFDSEKKKYKRVKLK
jgi:hypothetical protein